MSFNSNGKSAMDDLQPRILSLGKDLQLMNVATVGEDGKPYVRPVVGKMDECLNLRFSTQLDSNKVRHLRHNPNVHVTLGAADVCARTWLQVAGAAVVSTAEDERRAFWFDGLSAYVSGIDDPRYCIVIVKPVEIALCSMDNPLPQLWRPAV